MSHRVWARICGTKANHRFVCIQCGATTRKQSSHKEWSLFSNAVFYVVMWSLSSSSSSSLLSSLDSTFMLLWLRCALVSLCRSFLFYLSYYIVSFVYISLFLSLLRFFLFSYLSFFLLKIYNVIVYRLWKYAKNVCHTTKLEPSNQVDFLITSRPCMCVFLCWKRFLGMVQSCILCMNWKLKLTGFHAFNKWNIFNYFMHHA